MGYIIALVILIVVVPLLFVLFSRRTTGGGGTAMRHRDRGVTIEKPSSDQPTPKPGAEQRLPPG